MYELRQRKCKTKKCFNTFRVLAKSKQKYCSELCPQIHGVEKRVAGQAMRDKIRQHFNGARAKRGKKMGEPKIKWLKGTVAWFDDEKGQGFIVGEDKEFYFVHYSAIETKKKWKTLKKNSPVRFQPFQFDPSHIKHLKESC